MTHIARSEERRPQGDLPRLKIIKLFETSKVRHLTAEDVYKLLLTEGLDIGLATVYRVLTQFEQAGLLVRHHFESGKAVFELNEGKHHDHLVCMQCGRVEEFYDAEIEKRQMKVAQRARLRDQRARALSVRRLHEAALPAPQDRRSELRNLTPRAGALRFRVVGGIDVRRFDRIAAVELREAKPQRVKRPEIARRRRRR